MRPEILLLVRLLLNGLSVLIVGKVAPGVKVESFGAAVLFAIVVALLNTAAWHFLGLGQHTELKSFATLGIGTFLLNVVLFLIAGKIVPGITFSGCITAAIGAIGVGLLNGFLNVLLSRWFH